MDYRLFYAKGSASDGVRVILEEIGVPYELALSFRLKFQLLYNGNKSYPHPN